MLEIGDLVDKERLRNCGTAFRNSGEIRVSRRAPSGNYLLISSSKRHQWELSKNVVPAR